MSSMARFRLYIWMTVACLFAHASTMAAPAEQNPPAPAVQGTIETVHGVKVLRLWGDAGERGYACGYLMAEEIRSLIDGYLQNERFSGGAAGFKVMTQRMRGIMKLPAEHMDELRGMLAGMKRKLKGDLSVPRLGRALILDDLIMVNCIPDAVAFGCSSYAAWGSATENGNTLAGRNLDWHTIDVLRDSQIVVAVIPEARDAAAWMTVTWPGLIGCLTGMNEHGVTLSMHDASTGPPNLKSKPTPRGLILREAIEAARPGSAERDILAVLNAHRVLVGNIIPVAVPMREGAQPAMVFEYDSCSDGAGPAARFLRHCMPEKAARKDNHWQVATNHYCNHNIERQCGRYAKLKAGLTRSQDDADVRLTVESAFELLAGVSATGGLTTYHSVVFEPNRMKLHVSFCGEGKSAPTARRVELDVAKLLRRPN